VEKIKVLTRPALFIFIAGIVGLVAWDGNVAPLCTLPVLILLWRWTGSRRIAFLTVLTYYLVAGRGLYHGAGVFFGDATSLPGWIYGLGVWVVPSTLLAAVWGAVWGSRWRGWRLVAILVLISVPPLGIIGWANPITSAGALFPGWGWFGVLTTLALLVVFGVTQRPFLAALPFLVFAIVANGSYAPATIDGWMAIDTTLGSARDSSDEYDRLHSLLQLVQEQSDANPNAKVFVLPELVGGDWSMNSIWWRSTSDQLRAKGQTLLIGALQPYDQNRRYVNALFSIGQDAGQTMPDRVPVPLSMWKPWAVGGATAFWFNSGVATIQGHRVATLICYEQLLVWPVMVSLTKHPTILVGAANDWWARSTSISRIQREAVRAWGRAFSIPIVWAKNE